MFNSQVDIEIDKLQHESDNLDYQLDMVNKKLTTLHGQNQVLSTNEKHIN